MISKKLRVATLLGLLGLCLGANLALAEDGDCDPRESVCAPDPAFACPFRKPVNAPDTLCQCSNTVGFAGGLYDAPGSRARIESWLNAILSNPAAAGFPHLANDRPLLESIISELRERLRASASEEGSFAFLGSRMGINGCVWFARTIKDALDRQNKDLMTNGSGPLPARWVGIDREPSIFPEKGTLKLAGDEFKSAVLIKKLTRPDGSKYPSDATPSKLMRLYFEDQLRMMITLTLYGSERVKKDYPKYPLNLGKGGEIRGAYQGKWPLLLGLKDRTGAVIEAPLNRNWKTCESGSGHGVANIWNTWVKSGDQDRFTANTWSNPICQSPVTSPNSRTAHFPKDAGKIFAFVQDLADQMIAQARQGRVLAPEKYFFYDTRSEYRRAMVSFPEPREAMNRITEARIEIEDLRKRVDQAFEVLNGRKRELAGSNVTDSRSKPSLGDGSNHGLKTDGGSLLQQTEYADCALQAGDGLSTHIESDAFAPSKLHGNAQGPCILAAAKSYIEMGMTVRYAYSIWALVARTAFARGTLDPKLFKVAELELEPAPKRSLLARVWDWLVPSSEAAWPCGGPFRDGEITCEQFTSDSGTKGLDLCEEDCKDVKDALLKEIPSMDAEIARLQADNADGRHNATIQKILDDKNSREDRYSRARSTCLSVKMTRYKEKKWQGIRGCRTGDYTGKYLLEEAKSSCTCVDPGSGDTPSGGGGSSVVYSIIRTWDPLHFNTSSTAMTRGSLGFGTMACAPGRENSPECLSSANDGKGQFSAIKAGQNGTPPTGGGSGSEGSAGGAGGGLASQNLKGGGLAGSAGGAGGGSGGMGLGGSFGSAKTSANTGDGALSGMGGANDPNAALLAALEKGSGGKDGYKQGAGGAGAVGADGNGGMGAGFGSSFGGDGSLGAGSSGELSFGAEGKGDNPWTEGDPMKSRDPSDYFSRIGLDESLFKKVERRYGATAAHWKLEDLQAQLPGAAAARQPASKAPQKNPSAPLQGLK